jgi:hypothetical protein
MITAKQVRYIKLGRGGRWENTSLEQGELQFGHGKVSHELALTGDRARIKEALIKAGKSSQAATDDTREVLDFYQLGSDCLWATFARDHLWWTFAKAEITWLGPGEGHGERVRKCIGGWRNTDVNGVPLRIDQLSTKLTKVASYRRTICAIEAEDYLMRRINGVIEPLLAKGNQARDTLLNVLAEAIKALDWADFETLLDIMFARSGWNRLSPLGGTQKLVDLIVEQPTTGERAAIQVKSAASQKQLDQFINEADEAGSFDRLFFACHSPKGRLETRDRRDVHVWAGRKLAETALRLGLSDWIIEKVA